MTVTLSVMLLASCLTDRIKPVEKPVLIDLYFPEFPSMPSCTRNADGSVTVSGDYIVSLAEFKIKYEEAMKNYEDLRCIYE